MEERGVLFGWFSVAVSVAYVLFMIIFYFSGNEKLNLAFLMGLCLLCFLSHFFHARVLLFFLVKSVSELGAIAPFLDRYRLLIVGLVLAFVLIFS